jgi:predicted peptidase
MRHNAATNHVNTWRIACNVEGILAWLFEQRTERLVNG